jgi:hypothetical protein
MRKRTKTAEPTAESLDRIEQFGNCQFYEAGITFTQRLSKKVLPYDDLARAFVRVQEAAANLCCGRASFGTESLILRTKDGTEFTVKFADNRTADLALAALRRHAPNVPTGFVKEEEL